MLRAHWLPMRLVLYQPDIPQNAGAVMRLGACLGVGIDIIEPCGFVWDDRRIRRAGMDYDALVNVRRHSSWQAYCAATAARRQILLTTKSTVSHVSFRFHVDDHLILGRESSGVPDDVASHVDAALRIPMAGDARSLNVTTAGAIVLAEALRQTDAWPAIDLNTYSAQNLAQDPACE